MGRLIITVFAWHASTSVTSIDLCVCFFSSRRRHTRCLSDWSSDVCSSDLAAQQRNKRAEHRRFPSGGKFIGSLFLLRGHLVGRNLRHAVGWRRRCCRRRLCLQARSSRGQSTRASYSCFDKVSSRYGHLLLPPIFRTSKHPRFSHSSVRPCDRSMPANAYTRSCRQCGIMNIACMRGAKACTSIPTLTWKVTNSIPTAQKFSRAHARRVWSGFSPSEAGRVRGRWIAPSRLPSSTTGFLPL